MNQRHLVLCLVAAALVASIAGVLWMTTVPPHVEPIVPALAPPPAPEPAEKIESGIESAASQLAKKSTREVPNVAVGDPPIRTAVTSGILLHVSLVDEHDQPIRSGSVECTYGSRGLETARDVAHLRAPVVSDRTTIALPIAAMEALLTANAPNCLPVQLRMTDLRRKSGRWIKDDETVEYEPTLRLLPYAPLTSGISGRVFVDENEKLPAGLMITVRSEAKLPEGALYQPPRSAIVDESRSEYRFDSLAAGPWLIAAKSDDTVPSWFPVVLSDRSPSSEVDLHLSTGSTLVLHVRHAITKAACPGQQVRLNYSIVTGRTGESVRLEATSDQAGLCVFHSLPQGIRLAVRPAADTSDDPAPLVVELAASDRGEVHRDFWIGGADPTLAEYWGYVPEILADGEKPLRVNALGQAMQGPERFKYAEIHGKKWSIVLPPNATYELSLRRLNERMTETRKVLTKAGSFGPIELPLLTLVPFRISWSNAPIGCKLIAQGVPGTVETMLTEKEGVLEVQRPSDAGVSLELESAGNGFLYMGWAETLLGSELKVDLHGDTQFSTRLSLDGEPPTSTENLILAPLQVPPGMSFCFASIALDRGRAGPLPLVPGPYYFQMQSTVHREQGDAVAVVTGVVDVTGEPAGGKRMLSIDWQGTETSLAEWKLLGAAGFEVTQCGSQDLQTVPDYRRRCIFKDLVPPPTVLLFDQAHCKTRPLQQ